MPVTGVPDAVSIAVGDDVRDLLRRAAGLALGEGAARVEVQHVRRAIHDTP